MRLPLRGLLAASVFSAVSSVATANDIQILPSATAGTSSPPEVYLAGEITDDTVIQLKSLITSRSLSGSIVYLDSAGGDPQAGMRLGELLRKSSMNTAIGKPGKTSGRPSPGKCMSACVLTYAGGKFRFIDPASQLGIHRFYRRTALSTDLDVAQVLSAAITAYLIKMGVAPALFERMVQVGRGQMELLSHPDAAALNLVNNGVLPAEWGIEGKQGQVYLMGRQQTWNGTGKLIMSCAPNQRVKFSALYDAGDNNGFITRNATNYTLRINKQFLPIASLQGKPSVSGDYVLASFTPDDSMLWGISGGEQLGFGFHTKDSSTFYGFLVDATGEQDLVRSWIKHCTDR
ncbi:hypothetical protein QO021_29005 (plasmid) [Pseudomonas amygdali pv. lachrymans]|uniref:COG3904 family protein n=1 Tax=Pseudomonas amygdali TaxID=47877 RepID=UPI0006B9937F|nr:hypothetical protein [Pseudomonas amygdali]KPC02229.1 Uncharacterized protein AC501_3515 [Pseudomonas amygdali pv. lachrymans]RMM39018.1 hypothetical protein ALQ79_200416 [Pseudomonas amygdali pv. lachrymans]WIO61599.1 hypothetical protein QO021_29005 [Pseudomonas amygdali pv. lachrymans]